MQVRNRKRFITSPVSLKSDEYNAFYIVIKRLMKNKVAMLGLVVFLLICFSCILSPLLTKWDYYSINAEHLRESPSLDHPFGTDSFGRDVLTRMLYGGRITLRIAFASTIIAACAGTFAGVISGYFGKYADLIVSPVLDILDSVPVVVLALVFEAVFGWGRGYFMYAIAIASIPKFTQVVRGSVINAMENTFIEAARALGVSHFSIIYRHVLHNMISPLIVRFTIGVTEAILTCTIMGYLSIGISPPTPEWGAMVYSSSVYVLTNPIMLIIPCTVIAVSVISLSFFCDGLRDALNLKER